VPEAAGHGGRTAAIRRLFAAIRGHGPQDRWRAVLAGREAPQKPGDRGLASRCRN